MDEDKNKILKADFQRAFKFSRFEEQKSFEVARKDAIAATCALHGGSIHDHGEQMTEALKDLCDNQRALWGNDIRPEDNRWFQHFHKSGKQN